MCLGDVSVDGEEEEQVVPSRTGILVWLLDALACVAQSVSAHLLFSGPIQNTTLTGHHWPPLATTGHRWPGRPSHKLHRPARPIKWWPGRPLIQPTPFCSHLVRETYLAPPESPSPTSPASTLRSRVEFLVRLPIPLSRALSK